MRYFAYTIIAIVTASVVAGFFIIGSPKEERLRRFDDRRTGDLQTLQSAVINYYLAKDLLPSTLAELKEIPVIPVDPETGTPYAYSAKNKNTFSLCATFALPSIPNQGNFQTMPRAFPGMPNETNWDHGSGRACFEKQIDKDFYKNPRPL